MIIYTKGDLFKSPARFLVNAVNTVGVMGRGIAKEFKTLFPDMFQRYLRFCEDGLFDIGNLWIYHANNKSIINFPTKTDWRQPSKPEYIEAGLRKFAESYSEHSINSVAFPRIGCGNGELDWERTVQPLMVKYLGGLPIDIFIYEFINQYEVEHKDIEQMRAWLRNDPQTLAFAEFWDDIYALIKDGLLADKTNGGHKFEISSYENGEGTGIRIRHLPKSVFESLKLKISTLIPQKVRHVFIKDSDIVVSKDAMLSLWQAVRERGFCSSEMMPSGLDSLWDYLFPILRKLDYLEEVDFIMQNGSNIHCLQFFKPNSRSIFEGIEVSNLDRAI